MTSSALEVAGLALVAGAQILVVAIALALGTSALFGTRYSVVGRPWPLVRRVLALGPAELESEYRNRGKRPGGSG